MSLDKRLESRRSVKERMLCHWAEIPFDGGWITFVCLWCGASAGEGRVEGTDIEDTIDVVTCPECGRESALMIDHRGVTAQRLMSPADRAYLDWRTEQGRPATWSELTP